MCSSALREDLKLILSKTFEEVAKSQDVLLKMLYLYSTLYLSGQPAAWCEYCQHDYYTTLKKEGMEKIAELEEIQKRTCIPAWTGLKYIHKSGRHFNNELITDVQAIDLLERGFLSETDFIKIPEGFNPEDAKIVQEIIEEEKVKVPRKPRK
jgi:hypothetical protein